MAARHRAAVGEDETVTLVARRADKEAVLPGAQGLDRDIEHFREDPRECRRSEAHWLLA
jgi:hypothetical protein